MKKSLTVTLLILILLILGGCSKPSRSSQEYWTSAGTLVELGNFEGAIKQYKNIIKYYPEDDLTIKAMFAMAEIYKNNLKETDEAVKLYQSIVKKFPKSEKAPNAMFMIGYIYANDEKNLEKAKTAYNDFIDAYPDHSLVPSAKWEIKNLGKTLEELPELNQITTDEKIEK